ncbi:MAG: nucleotide exchange factor GrpE [Clostridiales bacterium]|nr:nucleotide exchange factor GrpE [Clostridiales bacterium]MDD7034662.1 nucleotide exchange factor GrpE [Bacillota bacterium]
MMEDNRDKVLEEQEGIEEREKTEEEDKEEKGKESTEEKAEGKEEPEEDENTRYLRLMADFQNYKKRVEKEKSDLRSYANEQIMSQLLEVLDNFERALLQEAGDGFKEGMEMIFRQLSDVLVKAGLAEIPALGEEFDPNFHNAVLTEETEEYESGKVSGVMQKGYTLNGKVIRPSMVKVVS